MRRTFLNVHSSAEPAFLNFRLARRELQNKRINKNHYPPEKGCNGNRLRLPFAFLFDMDDVRFSFEFAFPTPVITYSRYLSSPNPLVLNKHLLYSPSAKITISLSTTANQQSSPFSNTACPLVPSVISAISTFSSLSDTRTVSSTASE